ncbi:heavy metal-binding domain-containing protein [Nocardia sp. NBC_01327]|nr:heavy metal-binding domain-containing protein [Nocardia sp. NBC_01327]
MNQPMPPQQPFPQQPPQQGQPPQGGYAQQPQQPQQPYGQQQPPQQPVPQFPILVSTMNDVPGHKIVRVFGEVAGLTVRSRGIGANFTAGLRSLGGGEIHEYTQLLYQSRHEAVLRMCQHGMSFGANAVIAMRFDCNEIANTMSEVAAYGTAVFLEPAE